MTTMKSKNSTIDLVNDAEKLLQEWEADAVISEYELDKASVDSGTLHAKYLELYTLARLNLKKAEAKYSELRKVKWIYYMGKMSKEEMDKRGWDYDPFDGATKPLKSDLEMYINEDSELKNLDMIVEYKRTIFECLSEILNTIRWRHTNIKNAIEFKKFTAGM